MITTAVHARSSLQQALAWVLATLAAAGGLIHLEASADHRDLIVITVGFAAMGISQLVLAAITLVRPSPTSLFWISALHVTIALVWIASRTVGLPFIPGAEHVAQVGVADVVANTFSLAVVGIAIIVHSLDRSREAVPLRPSTTHTIGVVTLVGALILTIAALGETHDHSQQDAEVSAPVPTHSHDH